MNSKTFVPLTRKRLYYLDFLRIIATLGVITIHVSTNCGNSGNQYSTIILNAISRYCVPVFVMISGCFFLDNDRPLPLKKLFSKNIARLFLCYLFWTSIYTILFYLYQKQIDWIAGYHLWFLPMMTGLYILTPILRCVTRNKNMTEYLIIVLMVIFLLFFNIFNSGWFLNFYFIRYTCEQLNDGFSLCKYPLYFILGYYLNKFALNKYILSLVYASGILSVCLLPIIEIWLFVHQKSNSLVLNYFSVFVFSESIFVFTLTKKIFHKVNFRQKTLDLISFLSKYTFGIYLVHVAVLSLVKKTMFYDYIFIALLIVSIVSLGVSLILNHIPLVNKYLV